MATQETCSDLEALLRRAQKRLKRFGHPWALVGGLAVSAQTEPRFTRDVDLALAVASDADAEHLIRELQGEGYQVVAVVEQKATLRLSTVRLLPPEATGNEAILDLLFASSGIEPEIVAQARVLEVFPGLLLPVARVGHLLSLKLLARDDENRPQDAMDIKSLLQVATEEDLADARRAAQLIQERGFNRDRDLPQELQIVTTKGIASSHLNSGRMWSGSS